MAVRVALLVLLISLMHTYTMQKVNEGAPCECCMLATSCCHAPCTSCSGLYCNISMTSIASVLVMLSTVRCCKPRCSMQARPLSLNSIHCNPCRPWQFTVAGGDAYVRVYDRRKAEAASCSGEEEQGDAAASTRSFAAALATPVSLQSACRHTHHDSVDSVGCHHQCFPATTTWCHSL